MISNDKYSLQTAIYQSIVTCTSTSPPGHVMSLLPDIMFVRIFAICQVTQHNHYGTHFHVQRAGHWARLILTSKTGQDHHQGANADGGNFRIKWRILKFYSRARSARIGENKWYSN